MERPAGLDPLLMDLTRLSLMGLLAAAQWAEFPAVRDALELSDSALSKQAALLNREGYVEVRKGYVGKRPRTWLQLTPHGRKSLSLHVAALQRIADVATTGPASEPSVAPARPAGAPRPAIS